MLTVLSSAHSPIRTSSTSNPSEFRMLRNPMTKVLAYNTFTMRSLRKQYQAPISFGSSAECISQANRNSFPTSAVSRKTSRGQQTSGKKQYKFLPCIAADYILWGGGGNQKLRHFCWIYILENWFSTPSRLQALLFDNKFDLHPPLFMVMSKDKQADRQEH